MISDKQQTPPTLPTIDAYTMLVIETTSQRTASAMIKTHQENCDVIKLREEVWGNDKKQGLKTDVDRLKNAEASRKGVFQYAMDKLAGPVIVGVALFFLLGGAGKKECAEIPKQDYGTEQKCNK